MVSNKLEAMTLVIMAFAVLLLVGTAALIFRPYNPMEVYSVTLPSYICADSGTVPIVDREIHEDEVDSIRAIEVQSSWIAEDVPGVEQGTERIVAQTTLNPDQISAGRVSEESRSVRPVPEEPGEWWLTVHYIVRGSPNVQEVSVTSGNTATVLPKNASECEELA